MYKCLTIKELKGIKSVKLLDLEKINVICGKNSSGKSTVLEGIHSGSNRDVGIRFNDNVMSQMISKTEGVPGIKSASQPNPKQDLYIKAITDSIPPDGVVFNEEWNQVSQKAKNIIFGYRDRSFGKLNIPNPFEFLFPQNFNTILIPPKRKLEQSKQLDSSSSVSNTGEGLLDKLFSGKNKSDDNEERKTFIRIQKSFFEISDGYQFDIFIDDGNLLELKFTYKNEPWRKASECGMGLQDLLVILYFSICSQWHVILIEEPESHIHPDMQRRLMIFLREETDKQFFLSTHSNVFLDSMGTDRIFQTVFDKSVEIIDATSKAGVLNDLGYSISDNLVSDLVILVEGPTDIPVIEEYLIKKNILQKYNIKLWSLGGDIMDKHDLALLLQNFKLVALIDNDPGSKKVRNRFIKKCEEFGLPVHKLKKYSIENYFTIRVLKEVFGNQVPESIETIDPKTKLEEQIGFNVKNNSRKLAKAMNLEEIEGTDFDTFLNNVEVICQNETIDQ